jgi:hypothetical protein
MDIVGIQIQLIMLFNMGNLNVLSIFTKKGVLEMNVRALGLIAKAILNVSSMLMKNNCPYPEELLSTIVKKIIIPKWRAYVKIRFIVYYWMKRSV